jgi:hypothetical protein
MGMRGRGIQNVKAETGGKIIEEVSDCIHLENIISGLMKDIT